MIRVFNDSKYGTIRTAVVKGEPSFCLKDVCQMLEIKSIPECRGKLNESGIRLIDVDEGGSKKKMLFITADNLSGCLFQSPKAEAQQICEWLYLTVLPRLKTYVDYNVEQFKNPDITVKFLDQFEDLKIKANLMETSLKVNASKMNVIDTLFGTKNCYDLGLVHEMLKFKGLRNTQLLKILRSYNVLDMDNMPRQEFIDKRFFRVVESKVNQANHTVMIKRVYVYQSGLIFIEKIVKKFEGDKHAKTK